MTQEINNIIHAGLLAALLGSWYFFIIKGTSLKAAWRDFKWTFMMSSPERVLFYLDAVDRFSREKLTPYNARLSDLHKAKGDLVNLGDNLVNCYLLHGDERYIDRYEIIHKIVCKIDNLMAYTKAQRDIAYVQIFDAVDLEIGRR